MSDLGRGLAALVLLTACGGAPAPTPAAPAQSSKPTNDAQDKPAETTNPEASEDSASACPKGMNAIPAGTLYMGSLDGKGAADEHPQHKVAVAEFCLGAHEVSVGDYRACEKNKACDALPSEGRPATQLACSSKLSDPELPATCISYDEASRYCAWKGLRLPSEAEWEWAASGGDDKLDWPWGDAMPTIDRACWQHERGPCAVSGSAAGAFDLVGMAGNAAEWTSTPYGPYEKTSPKPDVLVVRGGSFASDKSDELRPKRRDSRARLVRDPTLGFRCAKSK